MLNPLIMVFTAQVLVADPAVAISVMGDVRVEAGGSTLALARFDEVPEGALITTSKYSAAQLRFASGSTIRLGPQTRLRIRQLEHSTTAAQRKEGFKLFAGRIWARVTSLFGEDSRFEVETANAVAGVRGTSFAILIGEGDKADQAEFALFEGAINLRAGGNNWDLNEPGSFARMSGTTMSERGHLDAQAQQDMMGSLGAAAKLAAGLPAQPKPHLPTLQLDTRGTRESIRDTLVGPNATVDSPITDNLPDGAGTGTVDLRILLRIPDAQ